MEVPTKVWSMSEGKITELILGEVVFRRTEPPHETEFAKPQRKALKIRNKIADEIKENPKNIEEIIKRHYPGVTEKTMKDYASRYRSSLGIARPRIRKSRPIRRISGVGIIPEILGDVKNNPKQAREVIQKHLPHLKKESLDKYAKAYLEYIGPDKGKIIGMKSKVTIYENVYNEINRNPPTEYPSIIQKYYGKLKRTTIRTYISSYINFVDFESKVQKTKSTMHHLWTQGITLTTKNIKEELPFSTQELAKIFKVLLQRRDININGDRYELIY